MQVQNQCIEHFVDLILTALTQPKNKIEQQSGYNSLHKIWTKKNNSSLYFTTLQYILKINCDNYNF